MSHSLLTVLPALIAQSKTDVQALLEDIKSAPQRFLFCNEPQLISCLEKNNNQLYQGDNLLVMASLVASTQLQHNPIDLIYVEPTFSKRNASTHNQLIIEITYLLPRLILMTELLKPGGALFCHLNWRVAPWLRVILDELLGNSQCVNEVIWQTHPAEGSHNTHFANAHDTLLFYRKSGGEPHWQDTFQAYSVNSQSQFRQRDEHGTFQLAPVDNPGGNGYRYDLGYGEKTPRNGYRMPEATARQWLAEGSLVVRPNRVPRRKHYLQLPGVKCRDVWSDIPRIHAQESLQFASQKPEALLERILLAASPSNGLVADFFAGSATLAITAQRLGRRFISCDASPAAHFLALRRLAAIKQQPHTQRILSYPNAATLLGTTRALASTIFESLNAVLLHSHDMDMLLAQCSHMPNTLLWLMQPDQPVSAACLQKALDQLKKADGQWHHIAILAWSVAPTFSEAYNASVQDHLSVYLLPTALLNSAAAHTDYLKNIELQPLPHFKSTIYKHVSESGNSYAVELSQYHLAKTNTWPKVHQQRHISAFSWQDVDYWAIDTNPQQNHFKPTLAWLKPLKSRQALSPIYRFTAIDNVQAGQRLAIRVINRLGQESRAICIAT